MLAGASGTIHQHEGVLHVVPDHTGHTGKELCACGRGRVVRGVRLGPQAPGTGGCSAWPAPTPLGYPSPHPLALGTSQLGTHLWAGVGATQGKGPGPWNQAHRDVVDTGTQEHSQGVGLGTATPRAPHKVGTILGAGAGVTTTRGAAPHWV